MSLDPSGKVGLTTKEVIISSNDPANPTVTAHVKAEVDHTLDLAPGKPIEAALFGQSDCARCHADPAEGLTGADLYRAVCEMCHGRLQEYAASLPQAIRDRDVLRRWIAEGKGKRGMPGYSADKGGPLTDEQLNTLVEGILTTQ